MLRIVAGRWGGRRIQAPKGAATRPTAEKVRQALFNVIAHLLALEGLALESLAVWDLYAGSGALGIEALSRGAARAVFVESHARTAAGIRANLERLGAAPETWRVVTARVEPWLADSGHGARPGAGRDARSEPAPGLILLDPPYAAGEIEAVLPLLEGSAAVPAGALIVVEAPAKLAPKPPPGLELLQVKGYGDTRVWFLRKRGQAPPPQSGERP
ncbi:MAG: 16S rRNA (guanine(966)-N(2))-methyltransferase RsmD [Candidatus Lambdaproteobacteria bacterium]|nr:16S rRNA (guanine(966)-N(2))-methyltransferase RsmD [Candidatus Lambdaproteobacteria bacterium]